MNIMFNMIVKETRIDKYKLVSVTFISILILSVFFYLNVKNSNELLINYTCVNPPTIMTNTYTISLTSIDPVRVGLSTNNFLVSGTVKHNNREFILNLVNKSLHVNGFKNNYVDDDGPMTKLVGLCSILDEIDSDVIIYLDDDIDYDLSQLDHLASYVRPKLVVGREGGFYVKNYLYHYRYLEEEFVTSNCFTQSMVIMGYGAVGIHKSDVIDVCLIYSNEIIPVEFKYIDDELLSLIYSRLNISMISSRRLKTYTNLGKSISNINSRRKDYSSYRSKLFSYY